MREFGLRFIFTGRQGNPLSDAVRYDLKREVARTMENAEFGRVFEDEHGNFENEFAYPAIYDYDPVCDELHICFYFAFPLPEHRGNIWRLQSELIPVLENFTENLNAHLHFYTLLI